MALLDRNIRKIPGSGKALALCYGCATADALLVVIQAVGLANALANLWAGKTLAEQMLWIALFAAAFALRHFLTWFKDGQLDRYARLATAEIRSDLAQAVYAAGPQSARQYGSGALITTLIEGVDQVRDYIALILPKVADLMVVPIVLAAALLALDPISGVIAIVMIPCIMFYMRMLGSFAKENAAKQHGKYQRMANHFVDSLRGLPTLKAFGQSKAHADSIFNTSEQFREATVRTLKSATLSSLVLDLFRVFALAAVAIMLGFRLMAGTVQIFPALAVLIILPEFFAAVRRYSTDFHASLDGRNQLRAINELLDRVPQAVEDPFPICSDVPELAMDQICFSYDKGSSDNALKGISLHTDGALRIGIVGASGSGKTTLAQLLAGFSSPASGTVTVDGVSGDSLACPSWQSKVTYTPQNPHIFYGTLASNIAFYYPDATEEQIANAANLAGLDCLIRELPEGLDTVIGEGGRSLSGGQAQRIALARAFLNEDRRVLVFDEPTAHLDIETEYALKERMLPLMEGRLVFFATHRLHWMKNMDLVLVMDKGEIVQQGTPQELSSIDGPYKELSNQMRGGDL